MNRYLKALLFPTKIFLLCGAVFGFIFLCLQLGTMWGGIVLFSILFVILFLLGLELNK